MGRHHLDAGEPYRPDEYRAPLLAPAALLAQPTLPWHPEQYAKVQGISVVYDADPATGETLYRLPGGECLTCDEIRARGWSFEPPRLVRTEKQS